jgi:hypothetical protein
MDRGLLARARRAVAMIAILALLSPSAAASELQPDQFLVGNPHCPGEFTTGLTTPADRALFQDLVTNAPGLAAVELCVASLGPVSGARLLVRTGTAGAPGPVIAAAEARISGRGLTWVRFELDGIAPVDPGSRIVLQLQRTAGDGLRWAVSCEKGLETCVDAYPAGAPGGDFGGDMVFRTFAGAPTRHGLQARAQPPLIAADR